MCPSIYNKSKQITEAELLRMTCKNWYIFFLLLYLLTCLLSSWLVRQHHHSSCSLSVIAFFRCKIVHTSEHTPSEVNREAFLAAPSTLHVICTTVYLNHAVTYPMHSTHNHIQCLILVTSLKLQSWYHRRPGSSSKFGSSVCISSPQISALVTLCKQKETSDNIIQLSPHIPEMSLHEGAQGSPWAHVSLLLRTDMENWCWHLVEVRALGLTTSWLVMYKAPQSLADH